MRTSSRQPAVGRAAVAAALLLTAGTVVPARAQPLRDLVEEALDQRVERIEIANLPIRDALSRLAQRTGVRFELDSQVVGLMPYGERTRVSVVIREMSLRAGLKRVCAGLGLRLKVTGDRVRLEPAPVLERLGRRLTMEEVELLAQLAASTWEQLRRAADIPLEFRFDPALPARQALSEVIGQIKGANALHQLDAAAETLGWAWRPAGRRIVFEPRIADVLRRLDQPLDMTYQRVALDELLVDLGRRVGLTVFFEPAALAKVDARDRVVDLIQHGVSVRQTLERICGNTGLRYRVRDEGVQIQAPLDSPAGPRASNIEHWVRIGLEIRPGITMDVFVRQDQLPAEIRAACQRKLSEIFGQSAPPGGPHAP